MRGTAWRCLIITGQDGDGSRPLKSSKSRSLRGQRAWDSTRGRQVICLTDRFILWLDSTPLDSWSSVQVRETFAPIREDGQLDARSHLVTITLPSQTGIH